MTKAKMIDFITGFETYPTMNSWNNANGYSYNVKIHKLPLTSSQKDAVYTMLSTQDFYDIINQIVEDWETNETWDFGTHFERDGKIEKADFSAGFNGRSGGHLVLYKWNGHNSCGTGWAFSKEELVEMEIDDVKHIYEVLLKFEELYNLLVEQVKHLAKTYTVEEEKYAVEKTRNVLIEK